MKLSRAIFKTFFLSLAIIANVHFAWAQTGGIIPNGLNVFLDNNGKPLSSGKIYFYNPSTTTPKSTYSDINLTIPNTNPVILDAAGRPSGSKSLFGTGNYRQIVQDKNSNIIWDVITSAAGSGSSGGSTATGDGDLVGTIKPWAGITAPNQYMFTYGQEISRTTFSVLFTAITSTQAVFCSSGSAVLTGLSDTTNFWIGMSVEVSCVSGGTSTVVSKTANTVTLAGNANLTTNVNAVFFPWGRGNGSTTFNLPDFRGLIPMGNNIMGGVASSNINDSFFGNTLAESAGAKGGNTGGSVFLIPSNLPPYTPTGTIVVAASPVTYPTANVSSGTGGGNSISLGSFSATASLTQLGASSQTVTATFTGTAQGGTSTSIGTVPPSKTVNFIIKVTPDVNSATASGVTSLGGMTGSIACGNGLTCTGNTISTNAGGNNISAQTITLTPPTGTTVAISSTQNVTGTVPSGAPGFLNQILIATDTGITGGQTDELQVKWNFGGTGTTGSRVALHGFTSQTANMDAADTGSIFVGVEGTSQLGGSDNGGAGTEKGIGIGTLSSASALAAASHIFGIYGINGEAFIVTGATVANRIAILATDQAGGIQGSSTNDAAFASSAFTTAAQFKNGVLFTDFQGLAPINSNGSLFRTINSATVTNGIEISSYIFTGNEYNGPNFKISGAGAIQLKTGYSAGFIASDASGNLTSAAFGTGVKTALGVNTNSNGGFPTYTQGTWTPAIATSGTAGTPAYSIQVGSYEIIGRQVTIRFSMFLSSWTGSPTGNISITGLPVASSNTTNDSGICTIGNYNVTGLAASNIGIAGNIAPNTSIILPIQQSNTGVSSITAAQFGTTGSIAGMCNYHT